MKTIQLNKVDKGIILIGEDTPGKNQVKEDVIKFFDSDNVSRLFLKKGKQVNYKKTYSGPIYHPLTELLVVEEIYSLLDIPFFYTAVETGIYVIEKNPVSKFTINPIIFLVFHPKYNLDFIKNKGFIERFIIIDEKSIISSFIFDLIK